VELSIYPIGISGGFSNSASGTWTSDNSGDYASYQVYGGAYQKVLKSNKNIYAPTLILTY